MRAPTGTSSLHQFQGTSEKTTQIPSEGSQLSGKLGQRMLALGLVSRTIQREAGHQPRRPPKSTFHKLRFYQE